MHFEYFLEIKVSRVEPGEIFRVAIEYLWFLYLQECQWSQASLL
jgi:hypothetical protein